MDPLLRQLGRVFLLVVMNAAFAGSEITLISLREGQIRRLEGRGKAGQALAGLARDPNRFLATIQVGITLAGFLASATAAVSLAQPLIEPLRFLGDAAEPVAVILVTILLTFVMLVLGELARSASRCSAPRHGHSWWHGRSGCSPSSPGRRSGC